MPLPDYAPPVIGSATSGGSIELHPGSCGSGVNQINSTPIFRSTRQMILQRRSSFSPGTLSLKVEGINASVAICNSAPLSETLSVVHA